MNVRTQGIKCNFTSNPWNIMSDALKQIEVF
jgi:hypothetical protein